MKQHSQVSLLFEHNGTSHNDVVLRVGSWIHRSDSYYHELDKPAGAPVDPVASIRAMLLQWKAALARAEEALPFYLPYDFSDQCSGWLRGVLTQGRIELVAGWSRREGWSFYPSDYSEVERGLTDFEPLDDFESFSIAKDELLDDIDRSLAALPISK